MFIRSASVIALTLAAPGSAFAPQPMGANSQTKTALHEANLSGASLNLDPELSAAIRSQVNYKPGEADTAFAKKYKHLVGKRLKTVGEAMNEFTQSLVVTVNPLYKNIVTDLVGTTHLIVVNARFQRDPLWCVGILSALDLVLKNYPEPEVGQKVINSLFKSVGMDEAEVRAEAQVMLDWISGKSAADVEAALSGEGDSPLATLSANIKADEFWMYSRYFGIGLLKLMEEVGIEMDKDEVYPIMENWMQNKLGVAHLTACADSDLYFKIRDKLSMMETMMKEIEIREKKRMAERLEEKAEMALLAAEKESKLQAEIDADGSTKEPEKVDA